MLKKIFLSLFYVFFPLLVGLLSSYFSNYNMYSSFNKPPLSPPGYIFGIVWTILYLLMGISYFLVKLKYENYDISHVSFWYYLQLIINFFWSIFFFRNNAYVFSFLWILFLIVAVIITFIKFLRLNKTSGYLLIPYLVWIVFAAYLNLGVAILN